jgi:hypothetical protein
MEAGALGKKVFFVYPPPVLTELTEELARREFEIYVARDHEKLRRVLGRSPDSIVFINIDEVLDEAGWETWVRSLTSDEATKAVGIGVVSFNDRSELREKFLMELQVGCGFVILKVGASKTSEILIKTLEANEARGRRKFVRALCPPGSGQCLVEFERMTLKGGLADLSSAGMAVRFEGDPSLRVGTVLRGISLVVKGFRAIADGFVVAHRDDPEGGGVHVIMFDPASLEGARREKLQILVYRINQAAMDRLLETA